MTGVLRLVLGDQLTRDLATLRDIDAERDVVLLVEVGEETTYVPHHKQKIAFILSAMRHFSAALSDEGFRVDHVRLTDEANTHSFTGEVKRALKRHKLTRLVVTEPGEWRVRQMMEEWEAWPDVEVEVRDDDRFLCSRDRFAWLKSARKTGRMEFFYREMRKATGLLMAGDQPEGGQWNFDHDNRKPLPPDFVSPKRLRFEPDAVTRDVIALVDERFAGHFGTLDQFGWPVSRKDALEALDHFIAECLPLFGDYQDAMKDGADFLCHSLLSPCLNAGLLTAREVCEAAVAAYEKGNAPLNAVEGFVRQILGWREFVRGIYWSEMPDYAATNHLSAKRNLPAFYWTGETDMRCMAECIRTTRDHAYAHHIQRLMVTGNFALLTGIEPAQIEEWYLAVYADAYDWVELPNVHGMVMHADGGLLGSKPYAASGAYINRMSDHCGSCRYKVSQKEGPDACPFNYLYWNFLIENEDVLARNARMAMPYKTLQRMGPERRREIMQDSARFLTSIEQDEPWKPEGAQLDLGL
ncbi:MAG: cryptochrome/photolyase family protein [Notoacmeibacter sp.]|nr:cryptochrome/photolyase family protein [Notoacmeibacter sp.]